MAQGPRDFTNPNLFYTDKLRFMENSVLAFLQALFSTFPKFGETDIPYNCFHYDHDDPTETEINIEGQETDNLRTVDNRPKIVVSRGPVTFQQAGINGFIGAQNLSMANQRHATIMSGSVGISCYSREGLEADRLAEICASSIEAFQPIIRKYGFLEIRTSQIGQRAMIKSDARPELFVTPVLLKTSVTSSWRREYVDPVALRKIILQVQAQPGNLNVSTIVIKP
jgi:hypothetical protein